MNKSLATAAAEPDDLAAIARGICEAHEAATTAAASALEHARRAGELLIEAKAKVAHGGWLPWLKEHVPFAERTAQNYMRIAKSWGAIEANTKRVADLSYREAVKLLGAPTGKEKAPRAATSGPEESEWLLLIKQAIQHHQELLRIYSPRIAELRRVISDGASGFDELIAAHKECTEILLNLRELDCRIRRSIGVSLLGSNGDDDRAAAEAVYPELKSPEAKKVMREAAVNEEDFERLVKKARKTRNPDWLTSQAISKLAQRTTAQP